VKLSEYRAPAVGLIIRLTALHRPGENSGPGELFEVPLHGSRAKADDADDLTLVEALAGMAEKEAQYSLPGGAEEGGADCCTHFRYDNTHYGFGRQAGLLRWDLEPRFQLFGFSRPAALPKEQGMVMNAEDGVRVVGPQRQQVRLVIERIAGAFVQSSARRSTVLPETADQLPEEVHRKVSLDHPMNHKPKRAVRFRHMLTFAALAFLCANLANATAPDFSFTLSTPDFRYQAGAALPAATKVTSASPPSSSRAPASDVSRHRAGWDTGPCLCRSG